MSPLLNVSCCFAVVLLLSLFTSSSTQPAERDNVEAEVRKRDFLKDEDEKAFKEGKNAGEMFFYQSDHKDLKLYGEAIPWSEPECIYESEADEAAGRCSYHTFHHLKRIAKFQEDSDEKYFSNSRATSLPRNHVRDTLFRPFRKYYPIENNKQISSSYRFLVVNPGTKSVRGTFESAKENSKHGFSAQNNKTTLPEMIQLDKNTVYHGVTSTSYRFHQHFAGTSDFFSGILTKTTSAFQHFLALYTKMVPDAEFLCGKTRDCHSLAECYFAEFINIHAYAGTTMNIRSGQVPKFAGAVHSSLYAKAFSPQHLQFLADSEEEGFIRQLGRTGFIFKGKDIMLTGSTAFYSDPPSGKPEKKYIWQWGTKGMFDYLGFRAPGLNFKVFTSLPLHSVELSFKPRYNKKGEKVNTRVELIRLLGLVERFSKELCVKWKVLSKAMEKKIKALWRELRGETGTANGEKSLKDMNFNQAYKYIFEKLYSVLSEDVFKDDVPEQWNVFLRLVMVQAKVEHDAHLRIFIGNERMLALKSEMDSMPVPIKLTVPDRYINTHANETSDDAEVPEEAVAEPVKSGEKSGENETALEEVSLEQSENCPLCLKPWDSEKSRSARMRHIFFHSGLHPICCDLCRECFVSVTARRAHFHCDGSVNHFVLSKAAGVPVVPALPSRVKGEEAILPPGDKFICLAEKCTAVFDTIEEANRHADEHLRKLDTLSSHRTVGSRDDFIYDWKANVEAGTAWALDKKRWVSKCGGGEGGLHGLKIFSSIKQAIMHLLWKDLHDKPTEGHYLKKNGKTQLTRPEFDSYMADDRLPAIDYSRMSFICVYNEVHGFLPAVDYGQSEGKDIIGKMRNHVLMVHRTDIFFRAGSPSGEHAIDKLARGNAAELDQYIKILVSEGGGKAEYIPFAEEKEFFEARRRTKREVRDRCTWNHFLTQQIFTCQAM